MDYFTWAFFLALDFLTSVWNGYAAGYNVRLISDRQGKWAASFSLLAFSALAVGFIGAANITISIVGIVAAYFITRLEPVLIWFYELTFVVTALVSIGFIIMMLGHSISNRLMKSTSPPLTMYDILTSIWSTVLFVRDTPVGEDMERMGVSSVERGASESGYGLLMVMILAVVTFPVINIYQAYLAGGNEGETFLEAEEGDTN